MSQISLQNLKKSFGKTQVIHDLSIDVKDGELIVIVGPSGCGKSTLCKSLVDLNSQPLHKSALFSPLLVALE